jgi:transposase
VDWRDELIESQNKIIAELRAELAQRDKIIAELKEQIVVLKERIAELERRLGLNSDNSSKPPSSDGLGKPTRIQSLREKSGKEPGGQPGHKGVTLEQVKDPDATKRYTVSCCPHCKTNLRDVPVSRINKRQVFDIPKIKPFVVEHQFEVKRCPGCLKKVEAQVTDISNISNAPVQYGPNTKAFVSYLQTYNFIPDDRTAKTMNDLFGVKLSAATVKNIVEEGAFKVYSITKKIKDKLINAPVKCADETGIRMEGKTRWIQTLCNDKLTYYRIQKKRSDMPQNLKGIVVHDYFRSYYSQLKDVRHALCNAHILRELKAVAEIDKEPWAKDMIKKLLEGLKASQQNPGGVPTEWLTKFKNLYDEIIDQGIEFHEGLAPLEQQKTGRFKRRPGHNLLLRLWNHSEDVLRFLHDPAVPFTNNCAEQALRMIKVKQKISGCFRTYRWAQHFLEIRTYLASAQKQGFNVLDALTSVFQTGPINLVFD